MTDKKKWKSRLLSSSIPLEFEVAKALSNLNFNVSFDYAYYRQENGVSKEFSTDIKGFLLFPRNNENKVNANLNILAECKYREEEKKWAFLPEVNRPDISHFTLGYTFKSLSEFSIVKNYKDHIYAFEGKFNFALKGVEISLSTGEVYDKDIRHGIMQLQYALPYILKSDIEGNLFGFLEDSDPTYTISVLVTNADLYIFNEDFSIERMKNIDDLDSIAKKVPYLICSSEIGPDFTQHHKSIFKNFCLLNEYESNLNTFEAFQKKQIHKKLQIYNSPIDTCNDLAESSYYILRKYYSQHFVCSFEHFPQFMEELVKVVSKVTKVRNKK